MKKIKHLMIWIGLLLSLVSCKDTMEAIGLGGAESPAEGVTLNIELPNFSEKQVGTRAGAEVESIHSITAVFYDNDKKYVGMAQVSSLTQQSDGSYNVKISNIPPATATIHLVANVDNLSKNEASDLQNLSKASVREIALDSPICWGSVTLNALLDGNAKASLLRQFAKITLKVADNIQSDFPEASAGLIVSNTASKSSIAPANYNTEPTDEGLAETTDLSSEKIGDGTTRVVTVNETSAGKACIIIKAKYNNVEGYYKVALYKDANKSTQYALLRNHNYTITVTKVNDYGFKTEEEAMKSEPENRLEAEIVDDNPAITKMIACKDYELGVSDHIDVSASTTEATITLVTTLSQTTQADGKLYGVSVKADNDWVKSNFEETSETTTPETGRLSSQGKKYTLKFTLDKNDKSEDARKATVTVTSGDLSLDLTITQAGFDFRREDPSRKVTLLDNGSTEVTTDYFKWLDETIQGIKPEKMQGAVRNQGLHFGVGNNTYSYQIPKLSGDEVTNTDNRFTVKDDGSYWNITLNNNNSSDFELWQSSFTIKNGEGINITYPVYHTGIFHQITTTDYQLAENDDANKKVKGWFYYEMVKVKGKTQTYYMLDRNLGASNNGPYIRETQALKDNEDAIGGYFQISQEKKTTDATQGNLSSALAPSGYTIPTNDMFNDLLDANTIKVKSYTTAQGETYSCAEIATTGDSQLKNIYLPYGGYLEGESLKNPIHVNLWTKTLLSGNQGFSTTSPEYGYWYIYFDIYNSKLGLSNMRFVSGSNGNNNGRYKAMPIRLVYN